MPREPKVPSCSFCGIPADQATKLVRGMSGSICADCIAACVAEVDSESTVSPQSPDVVHDVTPASIVAYLDQYVVGQEEAKQILAVATYNHIKRCFTKLSTPVEKSNIWLIGPSGSGKSLLAHHLARFLELPFASVDATTITEAGYVGEDPELLISRLLQDAKGDVRAAECGTVFVDEIDKLARTAGSSTGQRDIKGVGVQQSLLRMIEGDVVTASPEGRKRSNSNGPGEQVNTKNVLFILGGAFVGLDGQRVKKGMGMNQELVRKLEGPLSPEDLTRFGMIPELVGRVPIIAELKPLTRDDLVRILTEPKDAIARQYQALLAADGVSLRYDRSFLEGVAELAIKEGTGARGLRAIMERILLPHMFAAPMSKIERKGERQLRELVLTAADLPKKP